MGVLLVNLQQNRLVYHKQLCCVCVIVCVTIYYHQLPVAVVVTAGTAADVM
jgi:hypothetical protein